MVTSLRRHTHDHFSPAEYLVLSDAVELTDT
uniref:Uncharacterized protein n=1 Tax=Siphoviridae sp. ctwIa5 TaxID=2825729 RepID=A0A8S5PHM7_9CAUD|nr:MAG TPA: hypothetical protein [Siphoviridae sp. ctwIa5]